MRPLVVTRRKDNAVNQYVKAPSAGHLQLIDMAVHLFVSDSPPGPVDPIAGESDGRNAGQVRDGSAVVWSTLI